MVSCKVKQVFYASASQLGMLTMGMMYGYPGILIPALMEEKDHMKIDQHMASWIASLPGLSGLVTVVLAGPLMDTFGRRITHLALLTPVLIGWVLMSLSNSVTMLVIARALQGLSNGLIFFFAICMSEFTCPTLRELTLNLKTFTVSMGILIIHACGFFLHWTSLALVGAIPALVSLVIAWFWPHTPDYLVSKHRYEEAKIIFFSLRGKDQESELEINNMIRTEMKRVEVEGTNKFSFRDKFKKFSSPVLWKPILLIVCVMAVPELGGRHFFPSYCLQLVEQITGDKSQALQYACILDAISVVSCTFSIYLVKKFSRRKLYLRSGYAAVTFMFIFCLLMYIRKTYYESKLLLILSSICIGIYYMIVYGATFVLSYILTGELSPLEYRSIGTVIDGITSSLILTATYKIMPLLHNNLDIHGMFFIFSATILVCLLYMHYNLPETKDRTLHDISEHFRGNNEMSCDKVLENVEVLTPLNAPSVNKS